jgi:hypothetical protein
MLMVEHKNKRMVAALTFLVRYHQEGDNFFLDQIAIGSETWVSHRP